MSIDYQAQGRVAIITICREDEMNAIDPEHNAALASAMTRFEDDAGLRVAVLTGAGSRAFCAGFDLRRSVPAFRECVIRGEAPPWQLGGLTGPHRPSKPVLAAVNGHALAGGCELALACDLRHASTTATFGLPETRLGVVPGAGGSIRLPREIPLGMAAEMILSGDPIDAETALRVGLINRIWEPEDLLPGVVVLAERIAASAPKAVAAARTSLYGAAEENNHTALVDEHGHFVRAMASEEAAEGFRAQAERRPPDFDAI